MRLALIGNSHIAAMKRAADLGAVPPGIDVTFFGSSAATPANLALRERALVPQSDAARASYLLTAGAEQIDLDAFDAFVLVGLTFEIRQYFKLFGGHVRFAHRALAPSYQLISDAAVAQAVEDVLTTNPGRRVGRAIRATVDKPVLLVPSPCPSEQILERRSFRHWKRALRGAYPGVVYEEFREVAQRLAEEEGFIYLPHNRDLLAFPGFTQERYATGSRLGWTPETRAPRGRGNEWHMNADFGRIVIQDMAAAIDAHGLRRKAAA